jgi:HSP20 family protein
MIKYYMTRPVVRRAGYHPVGFNGGSRIPVDVRADHDAYTITAITPGLKAEDLKIEILGDVVTLRGEIRPAEGLDKADLLVNELAYGEFSRTLRLPETVNAEKAEAKLVDGMLTVHLPKTEESKPREIPVRPN